MELRQVNLGQPCDSVNAVLKAEYEKGESAGIRLFVQLPEIQLRVLEEDVEAELKAEELK